MFSVLVPLPHLRYSYPLLSWSLPMEKGSSHAGWDYDQRDIAIHPERWEGKSGEECTLWPSWNPCPGPMV